MLESVAHPLSVAVLAATGAHHGGRAVFWIIGWLIVLAVIVGIVIFVWRRRHQPSPPRDEWPRRSSSPSESDLGGPPPRASRRNQP